MLPQPEDESAEPSPETPLGPRRRLYAQHVRERRRRYITLGLGVALCALLVNAIVGENGYLAALRLRVEEAELAASVAALRRENQRLQQEARRLREDPAALEEAARGELGLIKPGETLVVIRDAVPSTPATGR